MAQKQVSLLIHSLHGTSQKGMTVADGLGSQNSLVNVGMTQLICVFPGDPWVLITIMGYPYNNLNS